MFLVNPSVSNIPMTCHMCSSDAPLYQTINLSVKPNPRGINPTLNIDSNNPLLPLLVIRFFSLPCELFVFHFYYVKIIEWHKLYSKILQCAVQNNIKYTHYSIGSVINHYQSRPSYRPDVYLKLTENIICLSEVKHVAEMLLR